MKATFQGTFPSTVAFSVSKNCVKLYYENKFALCNSLLVPKVECWKWSICWTPKICSPVRKRNTYVVAIKNVRELNLG